MKPNIVRRYRHNPILTKAIPYPVETEVIGTLGNPTRVVVCRSGGVPSFQMALVESDRSNLSPATIV